MQVLKILWCRIFHAPHHFFHPMRWNDGKLEQKAHCRKCDRQWRNM